MKCLIENLEVNYPCSRACSLYGDCVTAFLEARKQQVRTNAGLIRSMSDEELARNINRLLEGEISIPYCRELPECDADVERDVPIPLERCEQCVLHWLRQPAEEVLGALDGGGADA